MMRPSPAGGPPGILLVTGPSGAGRSTALGALEDTGFEVIDNLPLSLVPSVAAGPRARPLALGLSARNRDWCPDALARALDGLDGLGPQAASVLFLDCDADVLRRRYAETRRRHPLAPEGSPEDGIARERPLLDGIRARADLLIDTTAMSPRDLRLAVAGRFAAGPSPMAVTVESFSFREGAPLGLDVALDCRFLRNPHWEDGLRPHDGRDAAVAAYVRADPRFAPFMAGLRALLAAMLPAFRDEGRAHVAVGLGCTGGRHRSVTAAETLAEALAADGWRVSKRHRELGRAGDAVGLARDGAGHGTPGAAGDADAAGPAMGAATGPEPRPEPAP